MNLAYNIKHKHVIITVLDCTNRYSDDIIFPIHCSIYLYFITVRLHTTFMVNMCKLIFNSHLILCLNHLFIVVRFIPDFYRVWLANILFGLYGSFLVFDILFSLRNKDKLILANKILRICNSLAWAALRMVSLGAFAVMNSVVNPANLVRSVKTSISSKSNVIITYASNPIFIPSYVRWPVITTMVVFTLV